MWWPEPNTIQCKNPCRAGGCSYLQWTGHHQPLARVESKVRCTTHDHVKAAARYLPLDGLIHDETRLTVVVHRYAACISLRQCRQFWFSNCCLELFPLLTWVLFYRVGRRRRPFLAPDGASQDVALSCLFKLAGRHGDYLFCWMMSDDDDDDDGVMIDPVDQQGLGVT